jgi:DNA-binding helix-hairpin-helix protein with protein kinase domain
MKNNNSIKNDEQLIIVIEQLNRVKSALSFLEEEVKSKNNKRFKLMAEGYKLQISKFQKEIDDYKKEKK